MANPPRKRMVKKAVIQTNVLLISALALALAGSGISLWSNVKLRFVLALAPSIKIIIIFYLK
jgi:hypothetical protein